MKKEKRFEKLKKTDLSKICGGAARKEDETYSVGDGETSENEYGCTDVETVEYWDDGRFKQSCACWTCKD